MKLTKKFLAAAVSLTLSASMLLSGCGKVEGDADDKDAQKVENISESAKVAVSTVGSTAENIKDIFTGQSDKAFSGEMSVSFGADAAKDLGVDKLEDFSLTSDVKAKDGNFETLLGVKYGGEELINADIVREESTGNIYFGSKQLSSAYLYVTGEEIEAAISEIEGELGEGMSTNTLAEIFTVDPYLTMNGEEMSDEDVQLLEKKLDEYAEEIEKNAPQGAEGEKITGEIDGVSYTLDSKEYIVSGNDALNIVTAVTDKLKADDELLDMFTKYFDSQQVGKQDIIDAVDEFVADMKDSGGLDETVPFTAYYQDDEFAGMAFNVDGESLDMLWYVEDEAACAKLIVDGTDDGEDVNMTASANIDGGATDVSAKLDIPGEASISFKIDDFMIVDEESGAFKGSVDISVSDSEQTMSITAKSDSTSSKLDMSAQMSMNGEKLMSVSLTGKETKATDIKIPSGKLFDATDDEQMEQYAATIDPDKLQKDIKSALGDELYSAIFDSGYDDHDYDYDIDDYYDPYEEDYGNGVGDDDQPYTGIGKADEYFGDI